MPLKMESLEKLLHSKERFLILMGLIMGLLVLGPILEQFVANRILIDIFLTAIVLSIYGSCYCAYAGVYHQIRDGYQGSRLCGHAGLSPGGTTMGIGIYVFGFD